MPLQNWVQISLYLAWKQKSSSSFKKVFCLANVVGKLNPIQYPFREGVEVMKIEASRLEELNKVKKMRRRRLVVGLLIFLLVKPWRSGRDYSAMESGKTWLATDLEFQKLSFHMEISETGFEPNLTHSLSLSFYFF